MGSIASNLQEVRQRIARACAEAGRDAENVTLLAVGKTFPAHSVREAYAAGQRAFGENYVQEALEKIEALADLRSALQWHLIGPLQKALLLTSAGPREGKTTTAINLATVLAYSGGRTLIIDADLRKPRIHKSFGIGNTRGLTNLIIGGDDPVALCQKTAVERVDLLPSGPIPPNPSELLGHPRMREVLRKLLDHYDHVIVDTPPIGAVTFSGSRVCTSARARSSRSSRTPRARRGSTRCANGRSPWGGLTTASS